MNRNHDATRNLRYPLAALPESRPKRARRRSAWGAWLAIAALVIGLVAAAPGRAAEEEAGLSASPNPSTNGSYTVSWTAKPGATSYQLFEGDTESYTGSSLSKAYSGKANGTYTYTLKYCIYAGFPVGTTICNIPSLYDALTVTVSDPPEPTGTISASPSPCSIPAGQRRCTTTVTWSTSNATKPCIFLSTESKFVCGASGTKDAPWVTSTGRTFLLKNGNTFSADTLASVTVSGTLLPPGAPTLTVPATNSDGAYTVSWSSPTGATRYKLEQKIGTGNWTASYSGTDSSKAYTGKGDGTYSYRAKACIGTTPCSGWSTTGSVRVLRTPGVPGAISGPANDTDGSFTLSWSAASGTVATYELQERTGSSGSWDTVQNTSARSKSISKTADATYQYQVRACNALSCSGWTAAKSVRVLRTPGVPGAISGPANDTDGSFTLSWSAASGTVATYELQERTGSSGSWDTVQNTNARSKSISKTADATYQYQVRACNALSCSGWTAAKSVRVLRTPGVPGAISGPANDTDGRFRLSWSAASGTVATYELQERTGSSGSWDTVQNTNARSKSISKTADATYQYQVRACNALSCSGWTAAKSVRVLRTPGVPGAISGPANDTDGRFRLSWSAASGTVATYELQERTGSSGSWSTVQNTSARSKSISKTADATYQYQVRACNALSCSSWTGTKSVTVLKTPGVPGAIQGPLTSTGAYTLTWGAAAGTVATYQLQEKVGTGTWSTVQNTSARSKGFSKSAENMYSYQVRACNRLSCGDFTSAKAIEVALSPPPVPSPFTVPSFDQDGAYSISWGSSTGATSYELQERANSLDATAWTGITLDSDDDTSADLTGKANGAYHYRVRACKGTTLCSDWTEPKITAVLRLGMTVTVTPDPAPQGSYTVSWTSSSPAQFYLLEESSDNKASWKQFSNHYTLREQSFSGKAKGVYWYRVVGCFIAYEIGGRLCPFQGAAEDVTVPNRAPAAAADNWATTRNQAVTIDVLANDTDSDGDALTVRSATDPANGTATVNSDGAVIYTPDAGFVGSDTFDYSVSDGDANAEGTATATVTVTVANQAPAAKPDEVSTFRGTEASIEVLANDTDPDGDALTVQTPTTAPANGSTTVNADGTITYAPAAGFTGEDTFEYSISDGRDTADATVTATVKNRAPKPQDDAAQTLHGGAVTIEVLANDTDPDGDALSLASATDPATGTATVNAEGTVTYTPDAGAGDSDRFEYTVTDGTDTASATVTVTIRANGAPIAVDDTAQTTRNQAVAVKVLANDRDPDGDALTVQLAITGPTNGTATVNADRTITYTPRTGYTGTDSFDYTISDGSATATATVSVTVNPTAPAGPLATDDKAETTRNRAVAIDVLANDFDPDGDALTVQPSTSAPANGTTAVNADGRITYTPNAGFAATDTFDYTITDGRATDTATVTVSVANRAPVAVDDETTTPRGAEVTSSVLANDTDPDGDTLTVRSATDPANGAVTVNTDGTIAYTPDDDFAGTDTFDYTITDALATASATVTVTVENQPPVAGPDSASTTVNTAVTIEVLANDADPDGDALSVSSATDPDDGSVTVNADGTIAYTPDAAFTGIDRFTYTISDGIDTATGQVTVAVGGFTVETPPAPYDAPLSLVTAAEQRDIDETGTMPGAFRVTESGAASYTMPIYAVPGTAGVTPELALTYNSQAGNGVAGLGWTIDGVSAIVRCRATTHQDAAAKPIQWNDQDRFCLDGQRLVLDSGTYGAPNATYRTEIDSFARIKALGGTAGHPDYFEVSGKDGSKRHYGNVPGGSHTDAKQRNGASQTLKWALKRFEDNIGNPIWYLYANDADGHRLTGVRYAYGAERAIGDHHARIEFVYEDREDDATGYVAGHAFSSRKRLDKVRTHNHDGTALTLLREIRISYRDVGSSLDKTSRLTEVQECTGSAPTAPCLPATTFTWETATAGFKSTASGQTDLTPRDDRGILNYQPADVNGDGNLDLVWLEWDRDGASDTDHHLRYALSDGAKLTAATFAGGGASIELFEDVERAQTVKMHVIDYNGDGRSDVILWRSRDPVWKVHLSTPQPTGGWKLTATPLWTPIATSTASFSDLNGDGLVDAAYGRGATVRARYLERDSAQADDSSRPYKFGAETVLHTVAPTTPLEVTPSLASTGVRAANHEFNGDGRADLLVFTRFEYDLGEAGGIISNTVHGPYVADAGGNWTRIANFGEAELQPADLNLDGLTDLIRSVRSTVDDDVRLTFHAEINTGDGFVSSPTGITLDAADVTVMEPMDHNGDGHPDFIWHDRDARRIKAYLWNPNTSAFDTATARTVRSTDGNRKRAHLFFDANGDGHTDYLHLTKLSSKGRLSTYLANNDGRTPRQVTAITNGLGAVTEIDYETLSRTDHYERLGLGGTETAARFCFDYLGASECLPYTRTAVSQDSIDAFYANLNGGWNLPSGAHTLGKAGPVLEFTGPVPVVTRVDGSAPKAGDAPGAVDANATSAVEYFYAEAKVQAMGRGLLGFQQLKTKDMQTAVETTTTYRQDFPFTGLPASTKVELPVTVDVPAQGDLPATTRVERRLLSESATTWKLKGYQNAWAQTARTSGTAAVDAFQPYAAQVVEKTYDLNDGTNTAPTLLATVTTDSEQDDHGNATSVTVTTVGGGGTFRTATANTYGPTEADRRNGRLTSTVVTTARDLNGDGALGASEQAVRRSDFNYYGQTPGGCPVTSAAHAGMLCQEIVEPTHERLKVTTTHWYDAFGNRTRSKVDYFDDTPAPGGAAVTGTARIKTRCGAAAAATAYDARGRFVQATADCLGRRLTEVTGRNAHGAPTGVKRYLNAARTGFVTDEFAHTARGVEYLRKSGTGAHALTTRRQGGHAQCPTGTAFHERVRPGGGGESVSCFDKLAREVRTATKGFDGTWIHRDVEYDALGRVRRASEPHYAGQANCQAGGGGQSRCWTAMTYDILSRVTETVLPDGSAAQASHVGYATTHTNALSQTRTEERNALGETVRTTDHEGGAVRFTHDVQGNVTSVAREKPAADTTAAPASVTTTMAYDLLGRRTAMTDPDRGAWSYRHNALGELTCRQGAAGHFTVMAYDGLGRMASRKDYRAHAGAGCSTLTGAQSGSLEANAVWTHDTAANGLGQLAEVTDSKSGYRKVHAYDAYGRPDTTATTPGTGNGTHYAKTTYDQHGRVFQAFDASRTSSAFTDNGVRHVYNGNGYLERFQDAVGSAGAGGTFTPRAVYRTVTAMDARGNVTAETLGNGIERSHAYDGRTGRVRTVRSGLGMARNRQDLAYDWDLLGNLSQRRRTRGGTTLTEEFCYDRLNRLNRSRLTTEAGARAKDLCGSPLSQLTGVDTVAYDGYGNIRARSGVGTYAYGAGTAGPHAVTSVTKPGSPPVTQTYSYDANGNNTSSSDGRAIAHTAFDKPKSIDKGNHTTTFAYGPDRTRFKRVDTVTEGTGPSRTERTTTTLYLGGVERITRPSGHVQVKRHIGGIAIETVGSVDGGCGRSDATAIQYVLRDHLGSVDVLTDASGGIDGDIRFDAWGWRAAASTGEPLADSAAKAFDHCETTRGFTDHEMLDEVGVVHMNGRIYDPALARFLQADPFVQFPGSVQSWNRYSYVMNNPLAHTDPTGHFIGTLATLAARTLVAHLAHRHLFSQVPLLGAVTGIYVCSQSVVACIDFAAHSAYAQTGSFSAALKAGAVQGISAAAFNAVGAGPFGYGPGDGAGQLLLNAAANGLVGGVMHELQGGRFGHGFLASGASALAKPAIHAAFGTGAAGKPYRIAARAAVGGTLSSATGGKFVNGAATAAFSQAYNDERSLENRRALAMELERLRQEGILDPDRSFKTPDEAAREVLAATAPLSRRHGLEVGGSIYETEEGHKYTFPKIGTALDVRISKDYIGYHTHTHGRFRFSNYFNTSDPKRENHDYKWVRTARKDLYLGIQGAEGGVRIGVCEFGPCKGTGQFGSKPSRVLQ